MLSARDQILVMKVGGAERMKQRQIATLTAIETLDFSERRACVRVDELDPAVRTAIQNLSLSKARAEALVVGPSQEVIEMYIDGQRSRFINELQSRTKLGDQHRSPIPVAITGL